MGLFDSWENKTDASKLQEKYLTDFQKGKVNKANEIAEGIMQSVLELGTTIGLTKQQTLDKFNAQLAKQSDRLPYDNRVLGAAGEIVGELMVAAPMSTMGWFGAGGKVAQIFKQGLFGGLWDGITKPVSEGQSRAEQAGTAAAISGGATAVLGAISRPLEKVTNFDFKANIQSVKDASASLGVSPQLLGDFTGREITRAAEATNRARGGGVVERLKTNISELSDAAAKVEQKYTGGRVYSEETGRNVATAVKTNYKNATAEGNKLYKKLDALSESSGLSKINPTETKVAVNQVLDEYGDLFKALERPALASKFEAMAGRLGKEEVKQAQGAIVDEFGRPMIPEIKGPKEFTFKDIRQAREGLVDALQSAKQRNVFGPVESVRLSNIIEALDKDIDNWGTAASKNQEIADAWDAARNYWKGNVVPLRDADLAIAMIRDPNSGELKTDISKLAGKIVSSDSTGQEGAKRAAMMMAKVLPPDIKQDVAAYTFDTARKEATDAQGVFNPIKFSSFLQARKQNLQPFVDDNLDTLLNKYSFLSQSLTRNAGGMGADEAGTQMLRLAAGSAVGGPIGAAVMATPVNRIMEAISRNAFDSKAGRAIMLSGKTLDDFRPLVTGATLSDQVTEMEPQWVMPPELGGTTEPGMQEEEFVMPPELQERATPEKIGLGPEDVAPSISPMSGINPQLQPTM
jgi:hypothetical protein